MAAPSSRTMLKSSSAALNLFTKSKQLILNQITTLRASVFIDQLAVSDEKRLRDLNLLQLRDSIGRSVVEGMMMASGQRKVVDIVEEEEDDDDDGFDDSEDFDGLDSDDDDELDDVEFEDEDDQLKKVRTRSHRDL